MTQVTPESGRIYTGNCLDLMPEWPDASFDCCITDPPFNISKPSGLAWAFSSHVTMQAAWDRFDSDEFFAFNAAWLKEVKRLVRPSGNILVFGTYHNIYQLGFIMQGLGLHIVNSIIWFKPNAQPNITCRMFTESTEQIIWAVNAGENGAKGWTFNYEQAKNMNHGKQMRNMWEIPVTPKGEKIHGAHPSQKPESLIERIVLTVTRPDDLILDPFAGTGTTGVVAARNGRRWVMIERDPDYSATAGRRLAGVPAPENLDGRDKSHR